MTATTTSREIPLPSEYPGRADPSPASRDPLNSLICAILDPYRTIEEIAEDRRITVMTLGEILSEEPASSTIESLRKVFALRAEMLALHARASAVGTLTRIANSGKDDEVARRAATTLLRMFRPDDSPSPSSPVTDGGGAESARRRGIQRERGPSYPTPTSTDPISPRAAPTPPATPSEPGGAGGAASPSGSAAQPQPQSHQASRRSSMVQAASLSGVVTQHHHRQPPESGRLAHARPPP